MYRSPGALPPCQKGPITSFLEMAPQNTIVAGLHAEWYTVSERWEPDILQLCLHAAFYHGKLLPLDETIRLKDFRTFFHHSVHS